MSWRDWARAFGVRLKIKFSGMDARYDRCTICGDLRLFHQDKNHRFEEE